jgi:hypothetical protein
LGTGSSYEDERTGDWDMLRLAENRRTGLHPDYSKTWGASISQIPSLQKLELVLEAFGRRKDQLETVVECAKLWKFPLDETDSELAWDGVIEVANYGSGIDSIDPGHAAYYLAEEDSTNYIKGYMNLDDEGNWTCGKTDVEVRIVRFVRKLKSEESQASL